MVGASRRFDVQIPGLPSQYEPTQAGTTGRSLVLFREEAVEDGVSTLRDVTNFRVASVADLHDEPVADLVARGDAVVVFPELGVAVVDADVHEIRRAAVAAEGTSPILAIEPERIVYATDELSVDYLRGNRDATNSLIDQLMRGAGGSALLATTAVDESQATWGLQAVGVVASRFSGAGSRLAVLDTGIDLAHPDFTGRSIISQSFITGEAVQDGHGHGTHCAGTAAGPLRPSSLPRYGIAYNAELFVGKVLNNRGRGTDTSILAGLNWALSNRCQVVSMSLGAPTQPDQAFSVVFETVARRALGAGTVIVAAAGNGSRRSLGNIRSVSHPANCPSILAVGALDERLAIADFSNRGITVHGGQVDVACPGVNIRSSWPTPLGYESISGTSMATPHMAGVAALHAEAGAIAGAALWSRIAQTAQRLPLPSTDVGAGLVRAS